MASALDPNKEAVLRHRLDRALAARRAARPDHSAAARKGWIPRRHAIESDPIMRET